MNDITIYVCRGCRGPQPTDGPPPDDATPRPGAMLYQAAETAACDTPTACTISVVPVDCLANCNRGPSAAMQGQDRWTYVFGGLDPATGGPALIAGAQLLAESADGLLPWRGRPDALKRGLIARVPPAVPRSPG
ncbi:MAG: DUF1636 domain-containing protein [Azospirillaceae bacterium]|nr:DUF1636 domain-containing protein [Azospirillaceae bacterium]